MDEPLWITRRDALAIHEMQIAEHGGLGGIRDEGLLESALWRPENLYVYGEPDLSDLAAAYAYGLAKNHPFVDGNKRTSLGVCLAFLDVNGLTLPVEDDVNIATWQGLAAGTIGEMELAAWLRERVRMFTLDIVAEGKTVQSELIERGPVPKIFFDGWEVERIEDGMAYVAFYTEHTRDDGQAIRVVQSRFVTRLEVWEATLRSMERAVETFRRNLAAGEEELISATQVDRILAGESRIRVWREHRGFDAAALAEKASLKVDHLDAIEAGTRETTVEELRRLAAALGVTPDDLAG